MSQRPVRNVCFPFFVLQWIDYNSIQFKRLLILRAPLTENSDRIPLRDATIRCTGCFCPIRLAAWLTPSPALCCFLPLWMGSKGSSCSSIPFLYISLWRDFFMASCQTFKCECENSPLSAIAGHSSGHMKTINSLLCCILQLWSFFIGPGSRTRSLQQLKMLLPLCSQQ